MGGLLRRHDLLFQRAADQWIDGIPLANGAMGAMVWGDGAPLVFTLDSYGVWETRTPWPGDDPRFNYANLRRLKEEGRIEELREIALRRRNMRFTKNPPPHPTRLSLGRMEVRWPKPPQGFHARLDLFRAKASGTLRFQRGEAEVSSFICSTRNVLIFEVRARKGAMLPEIALLPAPVDAFSRKHLRSWKYPAPEVSEQPGRRILFRRYGEKKEYAIIAETVRAADKLTVFLTTVAGAEGEDTRGQALRLLAEARKLGVAALRREHEAEWSAYWEKSAIHLPDRSLERLFYLEMYKHHCSSRPGGLPVPIQGLWTTDGAWPPWRGNYTVDMNIQESYWPVYASNHLESAAPLYEMYWRNLPYHRRLGEYWYGKKLAVITGEHGPGGEPFPGYFTDEHCPSAGAWIAHHFWLHWLYSQDEEFLRGRAYPFMREMVQGYLHIMEKRADGKYHIPFTDSPEFFCGRPESLGDDTNYDLALLRFLLQSLLEAQPHLPSPDPDAARWRRVLDELLDYPVVLTGLYLYNCTALAPNEPAPDPKEHLCLAMRAGEPLPHSHRHHSHLIGIHPLGVIAPERLDGERRLVENSLVDLVFKGTGEWSGWSFPWASLVAGRAGEASMAHHFLRMYVDGFIRPNSLHTNDSDPRDPNGICARQGQAMTLEAGFAAAAAILEMLLQSHHGVIRLFPTCHPQWRDASFVNLRAEGAFLISAEMKDRQVRFVRVLSEVGKECCVQNPFGKECLLRGPGMRRARRIKRERFKFRTRPGGVYFLIPSPRGEKGKKVS